MQIYTVKEEKEIYRRKRLKKIFTQTSEKNPWVADRQDNKFFILIKKILKKKKNLYTLRNPEIRYTAVSRAGLAPNSRGITRDRLQKLKSL